MQLVNFPTMNDLALQLQIKSNINVPIGRSAIGSQLQLVCLPWIDDQCNQSHYREVLRWDIFMEQELRFGLDLGQLAVLKKRVWADYEQL